MGINNNQLVLLELLKFSLSSVTSNNQCDVDWNKILELAKSQLVVALIEPFVPFDEYWKELASQSKAHFIRSLFEQTAVLKKLEINTIPVIVLKGTTAAMYYPQPYLRTMGDIDLLVSEDNYEKAKRIIESSGYCFLDEDYRNSTFVKDIVEIELHYRFSSRENDIEELVKKGLNNSVRYSIDNFVFQGLPPVINGIVLLDHIRQHLVRSGLGIRQIIDWMMFVNAELSDEVWEREFKALAVETGLESLAITATFLCKKYLGLSSVTWCDAANPELADALLERVFVTGNFGVDNPKLEGIIKSMKRKGVFSLLQSAGEYNWPLAQKYSFFRHFAWVYQIGRYLRKGFVEIREGKNPLRGLKTEAEKDRLLERLEINE